jgi:hypothetical protein
MIVYLRKGYGKEYPFMYFNGTYRPRVGDIVVEEIFNEPMMVTRVCKETEEIRALIRPLGLTVRKLNIIRATSPSNRYNNQNNMETRTVKVSIEQARCWFNGNNKALKELALTVYSEQELTLSYESIKLQLGDNNLTTICTTVPYKELERLTVNSNLAVIAKYFNGDWRRTPRNKGYFIGKSETGFVSNRNMGNKLGIYRHETVMCAGIVYFKDEESAVKAFNMLTEIEKEILFS